VEFVECQKELMRHLGHDKSAAEMAKLSANGKAKATA